MMFTTSSLPLLFALIAPSVFAQPAPEVSQVHIGVNPGFVPGPEANIDVTLGICRDLPPQYILALSAIAPNNILTCELFPEEQCQGSGGVTVDGRSPALDLSQPPYNFDNRAWSIRCVRH